MKTVFIVNPMAGKKKNAEKLCEDIKRIAGELSADVEIYVTKAVGDATLFVRDYCKRHGPARFIACGGDGTLGEVLTGAIETADAQVGVIPMGTGNDFCRNFPGFKFNDIALQIKGYSIKCDAIKYTTELDGEASFGYCANMSNVGFDCNVVDMTDKIQKISLMLGPVAYYLAIFLVLVGKKGANLTVEYDGKLMHKGPLLLTNIANGCYCGGGMKSNPFACVNDGRINGNIIYNISRLNFLSKLPYYLKGTFPKLKNVEKIIYSGHCKKVTLTPEGGRMRLCVDGEIRDAGRTDFEIVENAFNLVVPDPSANPVHRPRGDYRLAQSADKVLSKQ